MTVQRAKRLIRAITGCDEMDSRLILFEILGRGRWQWTPDRRIVRVDSKHKTMQSE